MGFKCGNCGIDFPTKKELVEHMIEVHNSPFYDGDEKMIQMSKDHLVKSDKSNKAVLLENFERF